MIPVHELINRICREAVFAIGNFVIGYYDRKDEKIIQAPLRQVHLLTNDHFFLQVTNPHGYT